MDFTTNRKRLDYLSQLINSATLMHNIAYKEWERSQNYPASSIRMDFVKYYAAKTKKYLKIMQRLERWYLQRASQMLAKNNAVPILLSEVDNTIGMHMVQLAEAHSATINPIKN